MLPERREILSGLEQAQSLVVNPHKWLPVPMSLSVLYTSRPEILRRAFSLVPEYLKTSVASDERVVNLMDYSIPLGRRFRALKLWFAMRYFGRERIQSMLRVHIELAQRLVERIRDNPKFEVTAPVLFSVVCFRYKGSDDENRRILDAVNASGKAYISHTVLHGRYTLRMAIGNIGTTWSDVETAWKLIEDAAEKSAA